MRFAILMGVTILASVISEKPIAPDLLSRLGMMLLLAILAAMDLLELWHALGKE